MSEMNTPSSKWFANGDKDPHEGKYDCERHELTLGDLTDDELANEVFMWGDHKPSVEELLSGNAKISTHYLTAGKERIRWLSRKNNVLTEELQAKTDFLALKGAECERFREALVDLLECKGILTSDKDCVIKARQLLEQTK